MELAGAYPRARALFDPPSVGWKALWAIRAVTVLFFGAWVYANITSPYIGEWAGIVPIILGIFTYIVAVRVAAAVVSRQEIVAGSSLWLVSDGRQITWLRLWGARVGLLVLIAGGIGQVTVSEPIRTAGMAFGLAVLYWAALQTLSSPK